MKNPKSSLRALFTLFAVVGVTHLAQAATDTWTGLANGTSWNLPGNWSDINNAVPVNGDSLVFSGSGIGTLNDNLGGALTTYGITFDSSAYSAGGYTLNTLNGSSIFLSGQSSGNSIGVLNNSSGPQTVGLNLNLDWGYYTFSGSLALNGGLTLNPGGVAYFDPNVTSTSLTLDGTTGLITGLEGSGLMFSGNTPTGLATISGGSIMAYSGYTSLAGGATLAAATAIANGNNLNLSTAGSSCFYTNNNKTVNSITVAQTGNSGGTITTTLTNVGTLTLGQNGGVYLLGNTLGNKACFTLGGGTLTAGTSGPATITFAINGNNANNEATISSTIVNNTGGGAVSVIYTGPGSMNFATTTTSSYSGGLYVNQGQIQFGQTAQIGTGPVFVASNASLYFTGTGTLANNFFLSPGNGSPTAAAVANGGALEFSGSGTQTLSGTINLMGAPAPAATYPPTAGDRISGNLSASQTAVFTGQITGTGTLDLYVNPHAANFTLQNTTANPNNWQGGLIIEEVLPTPSSARNIIVKLGANNQLPSGAGVGDVTLFDADVSSQHSIVRLDLNGFNASINGLNASANGLNLPQITNSGTANSTLTFGGNNAGGTFNGTMGDGGTGKTLSLVKTGNGTETFNAALSHNGSTTVNGGTFALGSGSSIPNTPLITVASSGTLDASGIGGLTVGVAQTLNCVGSVIGSTVINGTVMALDPIGTLSNNGNVTLNGGGTYVWNINNATGTGGADPGWSELNITGSLQINASSGSPFNIDITSLTAGDVAGSAANFNPNVNGNWIIAKTTSGVSGFTGSGQFSINTSAFANAPTSSAQWSVGVVGNNLVLFYTSTPAITTSLVSITNSAGTTATFTVVANGAATPITFNWFQGSTPLSNGSDPSGSGATITITSVGHTSTLTIGGSGVQDADAGGYTVTVTNSSGASGSSSATLTVIDPPNGVNTSSSLGGPATVSAGSSAVITTTISSGTTPITYVLDLNGTAVATNTTGIFKITNVSSADAGAYTVVASNEAGSVTNTITVFNGVTQVPNQIVYEPFDSYAQQEWPGSPPGSDTWENMTNIYNQVTGEPAYWYRPSGGIAMVVEAQQMSTRNGGTYPWPGLAGDSAFNGVSANELYWTSPTANHLRFATNGFGPGSKIYFSFVWNADSGSLVANNADVIFGLGGSAASAVYQLGVQVNDAGGSGYLLGAFKGSGLALTPSSANGVWVGSPSFLLGQNIFVVGCYTVVSGGNTATDDTISLWLNPSSASFYANEANVPTPTVGPSSFGMANSPITEVIVHSSQTIGSHRIADLRIGSTWASVTPPSAPTLSLANQTVNPGDTAVFASQNAGNPAASYSWSFMGGPPLTDNGHITGSSSATLVISNVQAADLGSYTVTAMNTDPLTSATLTGSATATLSLISPVLEVAAIGGNKVTLSWSTSFAGYTLEKSPALAPSNWTTNSLPPYAIVGTNYVVTNNISGTEFFRLKK